VRAALVGSFFSAEASPSWASRWYYSIPCTGTVSRTSGARAARMLQGTVLYLYGTRLGILPFIDPAVGAPQPCSFSMRRRAKKQC
jgi:hypothetical protein